MKVTCNYCNNLYSEISSPRGIITLVIVIALSIIGILALSGVLPLGVTALPLGISSLIAALLIGLIHVVCLPRLYPKYKANDSFDNPPNPFQAAAINLDKV